MKTLLIVTLVLSVVWIYSCKEEKNEQVDLTSIINSLSTKDLRIYKGLGIETRHSSKDKVNVSKFSVFTKQKILKVPIIREITDTLRYLERYDVMEFSQSKDITDPTEAILFTKSFGDTLLESFISMKHIVQVSSNPRLGNFIIFDVENTKDRIVYCSDSSQIKHSRWKKIIRHARKFEDYPNFYVVQ